MTDSSAHTRSVIVERDFAHPPERLWRALTQPHLIEEWLMANDFAPVAGHRFRLRSDWGGMLDCEVLELRPNESLSYTWVFDNPDPAFGLRSVVTFTLERISNGTRLRMEQSGFRPDQKAAFGGAKAGWAKFFGKLDNLLSNMD